MDKCPMCGFTKIPGDAVFCPGCGRRLTGETCSLCGYGPAPLGSSYCPRCGKPLPSKSGKLTPEARQELDSLFRDEKSEKAHLSAPPQGKTKVCRGCGRKVAETEKTCPYCGKRLKRSAAGTLAFIAGMVILLAVITVAASIFLNVGGNSSAAPKTEPQATAAPTAAAETASAGTVKYEVADVITTYTDDPDGNRGMQTVVEIHNTGTVPLYLSGCTLTLTDDSGRQMQSLDLLNCVPRVVSAGGYGWFYSGGEQRLGDAVSFDNGCTAVPSVSAREATGSLRTHATENIELFSSYQSVGCRGTVRNDSGEDTGLIYVSVVYFNAWGRVLGISGTVISGVEQGGTAPFEASGILLPEFSLDDVADYRVFAEELYLQM